MIYLAQPYTAEGRPDVVEARWRIAMQVCAAMALRAEDVYSPIAHWHQIAVEHNLPSSAEFWWQHNLHVLDLCDGICILKLMGWERSKGLWIEVQHALNTGKKFYEVTNVKNGEFKLTDAHDIIESMKASRNEKGIK